MAICNTSLNWKQICEYCRSHITWTLTCVKLIAGKETPCNQQCKAQLGSVPGLVASAHVQDGSNPRPLCKPCRLHPQCGGCLPWSGGRWKSRRVRVCDKVGQYSPFNGQVTIRLSFYPCSLTAVANWRGIELLLLP